MSSHFLMCSPQFFDVKYSINPWMENQIGRVDVSSAMRQWNDFYKALSRVAKVSLIAPQPVVPDMVFTANAGFCFDGSIVLSRFCKPERQKEEGFFQEWFQSQGFPVIDMGDANCFEGAGDVLAQPDGRRVWAGYGFRTSRRAQESLAKTLKRPLVFLKLRDPRFYHLDTCFCPLPDGYAMYYPQAFDEDSLRRIEEHIPIERRIIVSDEDALQFACNAVSVGRIIFMNQCSANLEKRLGRAGFKAVRQPVPDFLKAGGANKCLTLDTSVRLLTEETKGRAA